MNKEKIHRSNFSQLVDRLIYPGILGSMIYDFLKFDFSIAFTIKSLILLFFIVDYCHLNFFMERKFTLREKNTYEYFLGDLAASILLVISFKYCETNFWLTTFCLAAVPLSFHQYSEKLKHNLKFYRIFAIVSLICLYSLLFLLPETCHNQKGILLFISTLSIIYISYNWYIFKYEISELDYNHINQVIPFQNQEEKEDNDWITTIVGIITLLLALSGFVVLFVFLKELYKTYSIFGSREILLQETAQVGDFVGGIVGSLWAFAGVILFFLALRLQRKEFKSQREELRHQKNEFQINRITNIIYKQLEILENKKNQLKISVPNSKEVLIGQDVIDKLPFRYSIKFNNTTDFKKLSKDQTELLALWEIAGSDVKIKEYVNSLLKYIKLTTGLINQAKSQKDSITIGDTKQLISIAYENIQSQRELIFLNLLKTLYEKDRSNKGDETYQQYLDGELNKLETLVNSLRTLRSASA